MVCRILMFMWFVGARSLESRHFHRFRRAQVSSIRLTYGCATDLYKSQPLCRLRVRPYQQTPGRRAQSRERKKNAKPRAGLYTLHYSLSRPDRDATVEGLDTPKWRRGKVEAECAWLTQAGAKAEASRPRRRYSFLV